MVGEYTVRGRVKDLDALSFHILVIKLLLNVELMQACSL